MIIPYITNKKRICGYFAGGYSCAISNCFCSSLEKITSLLTEGYCLKIYFVSAFPKEPVPPVINIDLSVSILLNLNIGYFIIKIKVAGWLHTIVA